MVKQVVVKMMEMKNCMSIEDSIFISIYENKL